MKKLVISLSLIIFCLAILPTSAQYSYAEKIYWAKVEQNGTYFYALADETSQLFILPESYFVKLTGEKDNFFSAQYRDIQGYVKKDEVSPMDGTPSNPYYIESFRAFLPAGTGLYAISQMMDEYKIIDIPYLYENLTYYGSIAGQTAIPEKSNIWHYCKYGEDYGYVYSIFCDKLESPPLNHESFSKIDSVSFEEPPIKALSQTAMAFIIIGVSLPCLIVLYLLIRPNMMKVSLPKEKSKYKAAKRRDYFEFDQSDLN
ncbi:MAG: hypothetical protein J6A28_01650 [Clostridia bacterium]|nr:hypothetical protein [Clostridia bacterium]